MIISVNWLKLYTDINLPIDELATLIGARLVEVEGVESLGEKYRSARIVKVVECKPLENSDHLNVTRIDDGGFVKDVERGDDGLIQVVCGAPNVHTGMLAVWLPPKSIVPETFGTSDEFVLGSKPLRGVVSNGMLASAKELDLWEDHTGLIEIPADVSIGSFAEQYQLDDYLLDIENKSLTHRPDTFGIIGFAREVAAIQGLDFKTPEAISRNVQPGIEIGTAVETPKITIDDTNLSSRYMGVVVGNIDRSKPVDLHAAIRLKISGMRPVNYLVDLSNYMMLETGQPLHFFDYDKLLKVGGGKIDIHVRGGRDGEKLKLLDGREIELDPSDIVVANGDTAVALAGAMGGAETEIDDKTTRIFIESATFNLYNLRSTQMRHGIFSEAITRFTKGQSSTQVAPALAVAVFGIEIHLGGVVMSGVAESYPVKSEPVVITISTTKLNSTLGANFSNEDIKTILGHAEFTVDIQGDDVKITSPWWRTDIHIPEDIYEEVGRLDGFDNIEPRLPERDFTAIEPSSFDQFRSKLRKLLTQAGANEVLTFSFVHGDLMRAAGQNPDDAYRIVNSISPELQYYRQSLTPSLLDLVHPNIKAGYDDFAIYEMNKFHTKKTGLNDENVPKEMDSLALVLTSKKSKYGTGYYQAKKYLDFLADKLNLDLVYEPLEADSTYPVTAPFEPKRSARVWDASTRERIGVIGEFKRSTAKVFKLPEATAGFEIATKGLEKIANNLDYSPSSRFPGTERDICFQVANDVTYDQLFQAILESTEDSQLNIDITPHDIYKPSDEVKNITVKLAINSNDKTLSSEDISQLVETVTTSVVKKFNAKIV